MNFKNGNLDCYSKSIDDFIVFLRNDIQEQIRNCRNNKNYEKYSDFLNKLENKIKDDEFIKMYFNNNRDERILIKRESMMENIVKADSLSWKFIDKIFSKKYLNFYLNNFLEKEDFESLREKSILNTKYCFDEVLIEKQWNNKFYIEYKSRKDFNYICFYVSDSYKNKDEAIIFENLQNYTNFIIKNSDDIYLKELRMKNCFYIKIKWWNKRGRWNIKGYEIAEELSNNIIKSINDEIIKDIVVKDNFQFFLDTFIPSNKIND